LNRRDFRGSAGFPLAAKTRYNSAESNRRRALAFPVSPGMAFRVKTRHWLGKV
jgi:hypothetical protein